MLVMRILTCSFAWVSSGLFCFSQWGEKINKFLHLFALLTSKKQPYNCVSNLSQIMHFYYFYTHLWFGCNKAMIQLVRFESIVSQVCSALLCNHLIDPLCFCRSSSHVSIFSCSTFHHIQMHKRPLAMSHVELQYKAGPLASMAIALCPLFNDSKWCTKACAFLFSGWKHCFELSTKH